jgi:glycosyltransferase involved in cell wall biosynthesis
MIKVAIIVPSLANKGPVKVVKNLVDASLLIENHNQVEYSLFYFDQVKELDFECRIHHISEIIPEEYDIIHTNGIRPDFWAYKNRARIKKHVITAHNFVFEDLKYSYNSVYSILFGYLWIQLWKKADRIVSLTNTMMKYYEKYIDIKKLTFAYNGIRKITIKSIEVDDLEQITKFQKSYKHIVGSICVLTKTKGLDIVIDYLQTDSTLGFIIIGDGKVKNDLINNAIKLDVLDQCLFLGFRNNAYNYYKFFDYFAMPSRFEGFGLSLIEAGLNKIPIICSDIPTFREMFDETQVSFFKLNSKESFKLAMIKSQQNRSKLTDELYQKCMRDYSLDSMFKQYHNIYKDVLQS